MAMSLLGFSIYYVPPILHQYLYERSHSPCFVSQCPKLSLYARGTEQRTTVVGFVGEAHKGCCRYMTSKHVEFIF